MTQSWLDDNLPRLIEKHGVPAASIAVLADGQVSEAAAGILNLGTGVAATTDSVFQIGSITKLWTATLAMQLVQEGKVDLDRPIGDHLLELSGERAAITPRQLLNHTSGIAGDAFIATSRGDDAIALFVNDVLPILDQVTEPGAGFSYNNSGYVILGRLVEVLRDGKPFHELLREYIGTPLGLRQLATIPDEALLHRAAVGHLRPTADEALQPASTWSMVHSMSPAGAMLAMSARDLITFGQAYLGNDLLDAGTIAAMWRPEIAIPPIGGSAKYQGLGWMIMHEPGAAPRMYGHDGGALGQTSFFRLLPDQGIAVVLLTNGGDSLGLYAELVDPVLRELAGVEPPMPLTPPVEPLPIPVELVRGRFESLLTTTEIRVDENGEVWVEDKPRTEEMRARTTVQPPRKAVALDATRLITSEPHEVLAFLEPGVDGRARYLYRGGRLRPRRD